MFIRQPEHNSAPALSGVVLADGDRQLRTLDEAALISQISRGDEVEISVASLTADTGIQGIAIGNIYHSWAIHEPPALQQLSLDDQIRHEVIRVEEACRAYIGEPDVHESLTAVQRARGLLRRAATWENFVGEFLFQVFIAADVFRDTRFLSAVEPFRGYSNPVPADLDQQIEDFQTSLTPAVLNNAPELERQTSRFRQDVVHGHQAALLTEFKLAISGELETLYSNLQAESLRASETAPGHSSLVAMPADQLFITYTRTVAKEIRKGFGAEWCAYSCTKDTVSQLRDENQQARARLEEQELRVRAATSEAPVERDLDRENRDRALVKDNLNKIAEYVGQRTTLLRLLRNELQDLRTGQDVKPSSVVIVGDLVVPCSLQVIPPSRRAGMICSEQNGIGHTHIAFTSTMKPIAGASDAVLNVLKSCNGETVVIYDGGRHRLIVNPTSDTVARYRVERDRLINQIERPLPQPLTDGRIRPLEIMINVRSAQEEVTRALGSMKAGVGLYTPESDFEFEALMEKTSVSRQREIFGKLLRLDPQHVTVRAFDFSGDKFKYRKEHNIRASTFAAGHSWTTRQELIEQFVAVLEAGASRRTPFTLLFPNITGTENLHSYLEVLDRAYETAQRAPMTGILQAGVQIESIQAVQNTFKILRGGEREGREPRIRLVAIGTNDLGMEVTQHEPGRAGDDRTTARVNHYNPELFYHIRSVRNQVDSFNRYQRSQHSYFEDIPLEVCGAMASQRILVPVLIGLGVNKFSVGIGSGHDIAGLVSRFNERACIELAESLVRCEDTDRVKLQLIDFWRSSFNGITLETRKDGEIVPIFDDER